MYLDFHTHGKLAKKLPFSADYTHWLFSEAKGAGLDALCLTEHFNTWGFEKVYRYIEEHSDRDGETLLFDGLRIFPGMETDIEEGGHILCIGTMEAVLELNTPGHDFGKQIGFRQIHTAGQFHGRADIAVQRKSMGRISPGDSHPSRQHQKGRLQALEGDAGVILLLNSGI